MVISKQNLEMDVVCINFGWAIFQDFSLLLFDLELLFLYSEKELNAIPLPLNAFGSE